jgi:mono/diheme cytochrome c family protein
MNRKNLWAAILLSAAGALQMSGPAFAKTAAELEKEKALQNPYPNDYGPAALEESVLKSYPADKQAGYKLLLQRCAQCHQPSRPLNSRFVEPDAGAITPANRAAKERAVEAKMKSEHPGWFNKPGVWQIEPEIWSRYVKRMLNKPGCGKAAGGQMTTEEAKKIYEFLVYDGQRRKLGANAEKWQAHREKLIEKLKNENPKRYEELKSQKDL